MRLRLILCCAYVALLVASRAPAQEYEVFEASVTVPGTSVERLHGELILPSGGPPSAVIVFIARGLSHSAFEDVQWRNRCLELRCAMLHAEIVGQQDSSGAPDQQVIRNAALGGDRGLLSLLDSLASTTGRDELRQAPLVLWGFSAAGSFAVTFAMVHSRRTAAVIRYHSHSRGIPVDYDQIQSIPILVVAGERDQVAGVADSEEFWATGRARQAPWSFILEPATEHMPPPNAFQRAVEIQVGWLAGVLGQLSTR
jgi:predicted esterase